MSRRIASSSSTSTQRLGVVLCWCNKPCVVKTSATELNPGRQFYGCPFWKDETKNCRFFRWVRQNADEDKQANSESSCSILKLEDSLRTAQCKAERRKKEMKILSDELSRLMKAHEIMVAEGRRVDHDIHVIRYQITVIVVLNLIMVVLLWHHFLM
ncbi:unnamed protein product [Linum trigynum]|uniref:GRF-type domain-containing protein n=2 Tax=Linum TaxID=4005 RepID=A0AAV2DEQ1_9ROSI